MEHVGEHSFVILPHILGMKSHHWEAIVWVTLAEVEHGLDALLVDVGQKNVFHASLTGSLDNLLAVFIKLWAVDMTMGVDHLMVASLR